MLWLYNFLKIVTHSNSEKLNETPSRLKIIRVGYVTAKLFTAKRLFSVQYFTKRFKLYYNQRIQVKQECIMTLRFLAMTAALGAFLLCMPITAGAVSYTTEGLKSKSSEAAAASQSGEVEPGVPGEIRILKPAELGECTKADDSLIKAVTKKSESLIKQIKEMSIEFSQEDMPKDMRDFRKLKRQNDKIMEKQEYFSSEEYMTAKQAAKRCGTDIPQYSLSDTSWLNN